MFEGLFSTQGLLPAVLATMRLADEARRFSSLAHLLTPHARRVLATGRRQVGWTSTLASRPIARNNESDRTRRSSVRTRVGATSTKSSGGGPASTRRRTRRAKG
jgi:hypothetical protein